jgi:hypothetical protein
VALKKNRLKNRASIFIALISPYLVMAAINDPFPFGYSMGNNGTIIQTNAISGRQPWTPASFYADTLRYGLSGGGIDYYDPMDNSGPSRICQAFGGAWYNNQKYTVKAYYAYLDGMGIYNEQQGVVSMAFRALPAASTGVEIQAYRAGLTDGSGEHSSFVQAGLSLLVSGRFASVSFLLSGIPLKSPLDDGIGRAPSVRAGVHTRLSGLGAQGVLVEISKAGDYALKVTVGEEYCLGKNFSLCTALSTNPFMLFFGVTASWTKSSASISFVNHPVLGWSKGLSFDWAH